MHWTVKPGRNCISFSPQRPARFMRRRPSGARPDFPDGRLLARILALPRSAVKRKDHNMLGYRCKSPVGRFDAHDAEKDKRRPCVVDDRGGARGVSWRKLRDGGREKW